MDDKEKNIFIHRTRALPAFITRISLDEMKKGTPLNEQTTLQMASASSAFLGFAYKLSGIDGSGEGYSTPDQQSATTKGLQAAFNQTAHELLQFIQTSPHNPLPVLHRPGFAEALWEASSAMMDAGIVFPEEFVPAVKRPCLKPVIGHQNESIAAMALIVQKFGGTSVGDIERIRNVATRVKKELDLGNQVAVVVSAMSGVTNQLVGYVNELSPLATQAAWSEYDQVVSSGEQVTSGLLALCLQEMGIPARSFSGWQIPLKTDTAHGKARINGIDAKMMHEVLKSGMVAVVAGFQGTTHDGRVTTLGRGGSDTSAVALAAALKADRCDIYTDVDGVYTTDPRIVPGARKLEKIAYEEMLEMASLGAKVLQTRSVEMAMNHNVVVQVLTSFADTPGTLLVKEEDIMEQKRITGIAFTRDDARVTLIGIPDKPGVAAAIFGPLADANINVDMIIQNIDEIGKVTDMTFTVGKGDLDRTLKAMEKAKPVLQYKELLADKNVAKISVVGVGMRSHAGVALDMFKALAEKGINILVISTSEIKISVLIAEEYLELAVRSLHAAFELEKA